MKQKILSLGLVAIFLFSIGCEKQEAKGALRFYIPGDPESIDPHVGIDRRCTIFQTALLEGLMRIGQEGKPVWGVANGCEVSDDKLTYTFFLRKTKWSNGEPLTAYDFERTWKLAVAPVSDCRNADYFYVFKNAKAIKTKQLPLEDLGIHALDSQRLKVELEHPTPYLFDLLASATFSPIFQKEGAFVGNGPFQIDAWEHQKKITLTPNPHYWDRDAVQLDKIEFPAIYDENTVLLMFEKGELDWAGRPCRDFPEEALPKLEAEGRLHKTPVSETFWLSVNPRISLLSSIKVRKALSIAIDRKRLAKEVFLGNLPTRTIFPEHLSPLGAGHLYEDANPIAARALFDEGMEELGLTRDTLPPLILNHSDALIQKRMAQVLQQEWEKALGIEIALQGDEWYTFFTKVNQGDYQIGGYWWPTPFFDPIANLEFFKEARAACNVCHWENLEFQSLLDQADYELDPKKRLDYLAKAESIFLNEMPVIPLISQLFQYAKNEEITDVLITPCGQIDFKYARFSR